MKNNFGNILKSLREEAQLSQRQLADNLRLGYSTIAMYESNKRNPNFETLEIIADYFNVDMNFLLGHSKIKNIYKHKLNSKLVEIPLDYIKFDDYFPLHYSTNLSAGSFDELLDAEPDAIVHVPLCFQAKRNRLYAFKINGESMNNVFEDGSIVIAEKIEFCQLRDGEIIVALYDTEATVKRFYKKDHCIMLVPDSRSKFFEPIIIDEDNPYGLEIIGRVIWHQNPDDISKYY